MSAFIYTYLLARYDGMTLIRPGLAFAGLLLLLAAMLWRRPRWRLAGLGKAPAAGTHGGLPRLLQPHAAPVMAAEPVAPAPAPTERRAPPFQQARLDAMFGEDRLVQGEILALFVAETRDRLAGIAHALRYARTGSARVLEQEIFDTSTALGLVQLRHLSGAAVHASFNNDIEAQRRLHADLLVALEVLSGEVTRLQQPQRHAGRRHDTASQR